MDSGMKSRLILGTAQLGMSYGINNQHGQPDSGLSREIVRSALDQGIKEFDTAQAYGESEQVLGNALEFLKACGKADVITKFDPKLDHSDADVLYSSVKGSLSRLRVPVLSGLMVHDENWLNDWDKGVAVAWHDCFKQGLARRLGISVYCPARALEALDKDEISFIQVPSNILDLRFENAGVFEKAGRLKKTVYIRSVFLQGILCMTPQELPPKMEFARAVIERFYNLARELGVGTMALALGYALVKWPQSPLVLGAERPEQIVENARLAERKFPVEWIKRAEAVLGQVDQRLINPMEWPK
jgi:aryl-alcohol dehydrogenase-like predicted oxidoreductase